MPEGRRICLSSKAATWVLVPLKSLGLGGAPHNYIGMSLSGQRLTLAAAALGEIIEEGRSPGTERRRSFRKEVPESPQTSILIVLGGGVGADVWWLRRYHFLCLQTRARYTKGFVDTPHHTVTYSSTLNLLFDQHSHEWEVYLCCLNYQGFFFNKTSPCDSCPGPYIVQPESVEGSILNSERTNTSKSIS